MITNGAPGSVTPATSRPAATTWASYQMAGISTCRWGSLASSGRPVAVRMPDSTQLLLPPARAVMSSHSRPGGSGGVSRRALAEASGRSEARPGTAGAPWPIASRIAGASGGRPPSSRFASAAPTARVSRPRTSSPRRFSARRQASSRAMDKRVDRRPRLRRQPEQEEFRRPPPAPHRRDCRVDARRIVFHPAADVWCGSLPLRCGSAPQSHCQESFVGPHRDRAEHLGQPPASGAPVDFHLPQPFPAMQEAEGGPRVIGIARVNVGHRLRVEEDLHGRGQPRQAKLPFERRHGSAEDEPAGRHGRQEQRQRQKEQAAQPAAAAVGLLHPWDNLRLGRSTAGLAKGPVGWSALVGLETVRLGSGVGVSTSRPVYSLHEALTTVGSGRPPRPHG